MRVFLIVAGNGRTLLQQKTVTQTAQATPALSTLVAALTKTGLAGAVHAPFPFISLFLHQAHLGLVDENCLDVLDIQDISDGLEANKVHT